MAGPPSAWAAQAPWSCPRSTGPLRVASCGLSTQLRDPVDLPLHVLHEEEIDEPGDVVLIDPSPRAFRDHEIDRAFPAHGREHDLTGP